MTQLDHSCQLNLGHLKLTLLPERAVYWADRRTLLVADLHLGKSEAFRRAGVAIPEGDTQDTLARLHKLVAQYQPQELILLGDILHARLTPNSPLPTQVQTWCQTAQLPRVTAIIGNHDNDLERIRDAFHIIPEGEIVDGLCLLHHPPAHPLKTPWVAGHWHPVAQLRHGGDRLRLPVFVHKSQEGVILPAFGSFTGGHEVPAMQGDQRYATSGQTIFTLDND